MKRLLQRTPLSTGNAIAWALFALCIGFAGGWIMSAERLYHYCMVP